MNAKAEIPVNATASLDIAKLSAALIIVVAALVAFYYFAEYSVLLRVLGLLAAVGLATAIAYQTEKGRMVAGFFHDAQIEVRKVVWPTREETVQTTLVVMIVVTVVAIALWLLDMFLGWAVQYLTLRGG